MYPCCAGPFQAGKKADGWAVDIVQQASQASGTLPSPQRPGMAGADRVGGAVEGLIDNCSRGSAADRRDKNSRRARGLDLVARRGIVPVDTARHGDVVLVARPRARATVHLDEATGLTVAHALAEQLGIIAPLRRERRDPRSLGPHVLLVP